MLFRYATVVALHVASLALGKSTSIYETSIKSRDYTLDIDKLKTYAQTAYEQTQAELSGSGNGENSNCSSSNLKVRREWYVCCDYFSSSEVNTSN